MRAGVRTIVRPDFDVTFAAPRSVVLLVLTTTPAFPATSFASALPASGLEPCAPVAQGAHRLARSAPAPVAPALIWVEVADPLGFSVSFHVSVPFVPVVVRAPDRSPEAPEPLRVADTRYALCAVPRAWCVRPAASAEATPMSA